MDDEKWTHQMEETKRQNDSQQTSKSWIYNKGKSKEIV